MNQKDYEAEAKLFKALNHPVRLAILDILRADEACVCHMEAHLGLRQAYISQQLMILREVGLVQDRRDGLNIYYQVTKPGIFEVIDALSRLNQKSETRNSSKSIVLSQHADCDCPKCRVQVGALMIV